MIVNYPEIKQVRNVKNEYLEVNLDHGCTITEKKRAFYLTDQRFLTCFVHLHDPLYLFLDCEGYLCVRTYIRTHRLSQAELTEWLLVMMDAFENCQRDCCLSDLNYLFLDAESLELHFSRLPIQTAYSSQQAFLDTLTELLELIDFSGDEAWLSNLYLLTKQRHFSFQTLQRFLKNKKTRKSIFYWLHRTVKQEEAFFQAYQPEEQGVIFSSPEEKTVMMDDFKTTLLNSTVAYGYLEDEKQQIILIESMPWIIGRQENCQCRLLYPEISKQHVRLEMQDHQCMLLDLGSTNGSKLNHVSLTPQVPIALHDGDIIDLAGHQLIYHAGFPIS